MQTWDFLDKSRRTIMSILIGKIQIQRIRKIIITIFGFFKLKNFILNLNPFINFLKF